MNKKTKYIIGGLSLMLVSTAVFGKKVKPKEGQTTVLANDGRPLRNAIIGGLVGIVGVSLLITAITTAK